MTILLTLAFGTLGVSTRYFLDSVIKFRDFPLATIIANVMGCFAAGWIYTSVVNNETRVALLIGFCGGLTTFSSLILQCLHLLKEGMLLRASIYLGASILSGFLATWAGMKFSQITPSF